MIISIDDFLQLRNELPVADVRSPGEYAEGHVPIAFNIPLLNNEERIAVGTDYKKNGQLAAIKTGFALVGPRIVDIVNEAERVASGRELLVHCWRGGMRSSNFCQFVGMARIKTRQLKGGYKSYRQRALESFSKPFQFIIVGGCTGSGKSEILRALENQGEQIIDLEGLAHHKGSAFGGLMMPAQPSTEQFQNNLFEAIQKLDLNRRIWIEDESIAIGKIFLPEPLWKQMTVSLVIEVEVDKTVRINRLVKEYGAADQNEFLHAMERITKKLGGLHFKEAKEKLLAGDMASVIDILLTYYDKAYQNGLEKKKQKIKHRVEWDGEEVNSFSEKIVKHIR